MLLLFVVVVVAVVFVVVDQRGICYLGAILATEVAVVEEVMTVVVAEVTVTVVAEEVIKGVLFIALVTFH